MSKVKFNICNGHVAKKITAQNGAVSYDTPFAVPGSVSLALEAQGEISPFYADGIVYYKSSSNSGYEGDWEVALVTDEFRKTILKEFLDANGVLIEKMGVNPEEFAFGFQIDGDGKSTRFWFYNCTATRPAAGGSTTEATKNPETETLSISATSEKVIPGSDDYVVRAKTTDQTDTTKYTNWFDAVYIPSASEYASGSEL